MRAAIRDGYTAAVLNRISTTSNEYRRQARRLRVRYARDPAMKLFALRTLAGAHDRQTFARHARVVIRPIQPESRDSVREFADRVTCELTGNGILRYSRRLALLNRAQRLGIDRFDANLMIAAVQNRLPDEWAPQHVFPRRRCSFLASLGLFAFVQSLIVASAWCLFT
jgi:hypothetical protein